MTLQILTTKTLPKCFNKVNKLWLWKDTSILIIYFIKYYHGGFEKIWISKFIYIIFHIFYHIDFACIDIRWRVNITSSSSSPLAPIERRDKYNTIQADSLSQYDFILSEEDEREKNTYSHPSLVVLMRMLSTILFLLAFVAMMQYLLVNRIRVLFVPPKSMVDIFLMIILSPGTIFPGCTRPSLFSLPYSLCFAPLDNSNEVHSKVLDVRALTNPTEDAFSWSM